MDDHPYSSGSVHFKVPPIVEANEGELAASGPLGTTG